MKKQELRSFLSDALRFERAFQERQVIVKYTGVAELHFPMTPEGCPMYKYIQGFPIFSEWAREFSIPRGIYPAISPCRTTEFSG